MHIFCPAEGEGRPTLMMSQGLANSYLLASGQMGVSGRCEWTFTFKLYKDLPVEVLQVSPQLVAVAGLELLLGTQRTRLPSRWTDKRGARGVT